MTDSGDKSHSGDKSLNIKDSIFEFLKNNKKSLLGYAFLTLSLPLAKILLPRVYGQIIDEVSKSKTINSEIKCKFFTVFVVWVIVQLLWACMNWIDSYFIPALQGHVRKNIVDKILESFKEHYHEQEIGALIAQIIRLPMIIKALLEQLRTYLLPAIVVLMLSILYFTYINVGLGLITFGAISSFFIAMRAFSNTCNAHVKGMNDEYNQMYEDISDTLMNLLNVYTAGATLDEMEKIVEQQEEYNKQYRKTILCSAKYRLVFNFLYLFLFFGINGYSFYLFYKKRIALDNIVTILIISLYLMTEMAHITSESDEFNYNIQTIKQIQESLDALDKIERTKSAHPTGESKSEGRAKRMSGNKRPDEIGGDIVYDNVSIRLGGDKSKDYLLKNISLVIPEGQKIAIVGEIGSGKTTLMNSLCRLIPYEGNISIGEENVKNVDIEYLRQNIIYVPQNPKLFNRTIYENIIYGSTPEEIPKEHVREILDKYEIKFDLDYNVGKNGGKLSGGQRQIIYLIRCFFKKSKILLLDEPTSSLDYVTKINIFNILQDLIEGKTVIMVTHDPEILKFVDRKITIGEGGILKDE